MYGVWMLVRPYDLKGGGGGCMSDRVSSRVVEMSSE